MIIDNFNFKLPSKTVKILYYFVQELFITTLGDIKSIFDVLMHVFFNALL